MQTALAYGVPAVLGFICAYFLALPANGVLSLVALAIGGSLLWQTRNAELGSLIGFIAMCEAGIFVLVQWGCIALIYHPALPSLNWLLRTAP